MQTIERKQKGKRISLAVKLSVYHLYKLWNLTFTTKQGSRVSWLAQTGFAAFGNEVQLISVSPYVETEDFTDLPRHVVYLPLIMIIYQNWAKGDIAHPLALIKCLPSRPGKALKLVPRGKYCFPTCRLPPTRVM